MSTPRPWYKWDDAAVPLCAANLRIILSRSITVSLYQDWAQIRADTTSQLERGRRLCPQIAIASRQALGMRARHPVTEAEAALEIAVAKARAEAAGEGEGGGRRRLA